MKNKNFISSFLNAIAGISSTVKKERNIKIQIAIMVLVIIAGIFFKLTMIEWIICIILFGLVISGELFNTAIESAVDHGGKNISNEAKLAKDASAGAVLFLAIIAAIIGLIIFIPKVLLLI